MQYPYEKLNFDQLPSWLKPNYQNYPLIKKIIDVVLAFNLICFLFWAFVIISILIKLDSQGSILIHQTRLGQDGKKFTLFKFRTMNKEDCQDAVSPTTPEDNRITNLGKFLRKYHLDELPQLLNILIGDMSFVGPRPEMEFIAQNYTTEQKQRLTIKPGLTGLWQVFGSKSKPIHEDLIHDIFYLNHQSLYLDFRIVLWTIEKVIFKPTSF